MKAKDTVIPITEDEKLLLDESELSCLALNRTRQAKLSFKAGIKEVVEWIYLHYLVEPDKNSLTRFYPFYHIDKQEVEAKLKEWGVE